MNNLTILNENSKNLNIRFSLDKYSKIVLTVIAACLLIITANILIKPGELNAYETTQDVNIKSINGSSLWGSELPVNLKQINGSSLSGGDIPVNLQSVRGKDLWDDKVPVDIKSINGSFIFGQELPVKVK